MMGKYKHLLFVGLAVVSIAFSINVFIPTHSVDAANGKCTNDQITQGYTQQSGKDADGNESFTCNPPAGKTTGDTSAQKSSVDNSNSTCAIEKLGWVLCPVMETVGRIGDRAFGFLADNFLRTEPELVSNSNYGTRMAWGLARNLANIAFIIALLIIIYSQVTGAGVTNYGIKKMLPRLIVAAIAVNLSYFICQGMVDLSNIFGYEIKAFLTDTAKQVSDYAAMPPAGSIFGSTDSPGALQTIIGYALGVASLVWFLLPLMFMSAGSIVIICVVIVIILLLRKAFIVLLVVVSPIAFVLYLLPNTERYFRKWLSMLWQLLMVFPVVALLFGSGQLASAIILSSGAGANSSQEGKPYYSGKDAKCVQLPKYSTTDSNGKPVGATSNEASIANCGTNSTSVMLGLIAAGIAVAPLFAVISVLKGALAAAGAIGGKISGAVESATKKSGEKVQEKYKASAIGQMRARDAKIRNAQIRAGNYKGRGGRVNPRNWRNSANAYLNDEDSKLNKALSPLGSGYAKQRQRMTGKEDNAWITEKAQEFKASGIAGDEAEISKLLNKLSGLDKNGNADRTITDADKKSALDELKAHSLATQGTALAREVSKAINDAANQASRTGAMSEEGRTYVQSVGRSYTATENQAADQRREQATALSNALAPHLAAFTGATPPPGGGGPTPGGGTGGTGAGPTPPPGGTP